MSFLDDLFQEYAIDKPNPVRVRTVDETVTGDLVIIFDFCIVVQRENGNRTLIPVDRINNITLIVASDEEKTEEDPPLKTEDDV